LADTSENGKIPMNGQLKSKPEIEKMSTPGVPAWKEVNTETTISSSNDQTVFSTTKLDDNHCVNVDGDFRSRPDKMADCDDVQ